MVFRFVVCNRQICWLSNTLTLFHIPNIQYIECNYKIYARSDYITENNTSTNSSRLDTFYKSNNLIFTTTYSFKSVHPAIIHPDLQLSDTRIESNRIEPYRTEQKHSIINWTAHGFFSFVCCSQFILIINLCIVCPASLLFHLYMVIITIYIVQFLFVIFIVVVRVASHLRMTT